MRGTGLLRLSALRLRAFLSLCKRRRGSKRMVLLQLRFAGTIDSSATVKVRAASIAKVAKEAVNR